MFCLVTGTKLEPDDVDARDGVFSSETAAIVELVGRRTSYRVGVVGGIGAGRSKGAQCNLDKGAGGLARNAAARGSSCFVVSNVTRARRELLSQG